MTAFHGRESLPDGDGQLTWENRKEVRREFLDIAWRMHDPMVANSRNNEDGKMRPNP